MTETAIRSKMDCIITRNKKDYAKAEIPIYDPIEFWNLLKNDDVNDIYSFSAQYILNNFGMSNLARKKLHLQIHSFFKRIFCLQTQPFYNLPR